MSLTASKKTKTSLLYFALLAMMCTMDRGMDSTRYAATIEFTTTKNLKQVKQCIYARNITTQLRASVFLLTKQTQSSIKLVDRFKDRWKHVRQGWEIAVLRLEPEELREEGQRLVGCAHGDGAANGGDHRDEAEDEVEHGQPAGGRPAAAPAAGGGHLEHGGLGGLLPAVLRHRGFAALHRGRARRRHRLR